MVQSARLGAWEARLESLAASVRFHSQLMERDGTTKVDKKEVTCLYLFIDMIRKQENPSQFAAE